MENSLPTGGFIKGKAHYLPLRIYYADTDFSGVVYHGRYIEFMERGRMEALRAFGLLAAKAAPAGTAADSPAEPIFFAISRLSLAFKAPAHIDDTLLVETVIENISAARCCTRQRIFRGETLLTDGSCCLVLINAAGRPRRMPDSWRRLFA